MAASVESAGQGTQLYVRGPASRGARGVTIGQACFHCCPFRHPTWSVPAAPLLNRLGANSPEGRSRWPAPACGAPDGWLVLAIVAIYTVSQSREGFLNSAFQRNQKGGSAVRHGSGQEGPRNPRSRAQSGTCVSQVSGPEWQECPVSRERGPGRRDGGAHGRRGLAVTARPRTRGVELLGRGRANGDSAGADGLGGVQLPDCRSLSVGLAVFPKPGGHSGSHPSPGHGTGGSCFVFQKLMKTAPRAVWAQLGAVRGTQEGSGATKAGPENRGARTHAWTHVDTRVDTYTQTHIHTRTHTWTHTPTLIHLWAHVQTLTVTHTRP